MTPEEKAVIAAEQRWAHTETIGQDEDAGEALQDAIQALDASIIAESVAMVTEVPRPWRLVCTGDLVRAKSGAWLHVEHTTRMRDGVHAELKNDAGKCATVVKAPEETVLVKRGPTGARADMLDGHFPETAVIES